MYGREQVTKEGILSKINDYDIFQHYCGNFPGVNQKFSSELRNDVNPSCIIGRYGDRLYYKDFAVEGTHDCISYIMVKYGVNFAQALNMINRDFDLKLSATCIMSNLPISVGAIRHNVDIRQFSAAPTLIKVKARA